MKKKEVKGLSAFELLEGLDDDMILSASLPEVTPVATPTVGEKITAFFGRMGRGGMAAAITGIVVVLAVLVGIALTRPPVDIDPPDTDPSHGIHGTQPHESGNLPDTNNGIVAPPLTQNPEQEKGPVAVTSDGITVYPQGYCVWESGQHRNEQGELEGYDADGRGAVDMLDRLWDMLPVLRTAGNDFDAVLPDHMTLRSVRVFEMVEVQTKTFVELALISGEMEDYRDRPWEFLSTLRGEYTVVLEVYHEINYSADEYTKGVDEYAFRLDVDPTMNEKAPVRVIHGDKTYFPTGYLLEASYYDAELKKEVVDHFGGAESILEHLVKDMVTATVTQGESLSLYLAPFYDLKSVKVYRDLTLWALSETEEPLTQLSEWDTGDYYFIITAAHIGTGETLVNEYPIHIRVVEKTEQETEDETYPNDVGETPDEPTDPLDRVLSKAEPMTPQTPDGTPLPDGSVLVGQTALYMPCFENGSSHGKRVSRMAVYRDGKNPYIHHLYADVLTDDGRIMMCETQEIHGYFALLEYDSIVVLATMEGDPSADGTSCTLYSTMETWLSWTDADNMTAEDLGDIRLQRVEYDHWVQQVPVDKLEKTYVKTVGRKWDQLSAVLRANGGAESFGVLVDFWTNTQSPRVYRHADSTSAEALEARDLILNVSQPYFDPVWETFVARLRDRIAGRDPVLPPASAENAVLVVMSGSGQSAVFNSTEEGFVAWREVDLSHIEGTRAADVIFTDDDAMRALPKMEIFYGDTLTLTLDAAGDDMIMVYLYDAKGGFIHSRPDLSVIEVLQNEGWDRHVIVILETVAVVSETERVCYEYAFELDIVQP